MVRRCGFVAALVILATATVVACAIPSPARNPEPAGATADALTLHTLTFDGHRRSYLAYVPANTGRSALPLVLVLHGGQGSSRRMSEPGQPGHRWQLLADRHRFLVVYPDALASNWHDCRSDAHAITGVADDLGFLRALIQRVSAGHSVDQRRIYVVGTSNGGMMAYRAAMELSGTIAAVGAVIANLPTDPAGECRQPDRPISVAIMNGGADTIMPWNGGCVAVPGKQCRGRVASAAATRDYWVRHNRLDPSPTFRGYRDLDTTDDSTISRTTYRGGPHWVEVAFFRVRGGGHTEPSIDHLHRQRKLRFVGPQNHDVEYADELWSFLRTKTRIPSASQQ